ncbi:hypothetical protein DITRI_Ditri10aG0063600 [Diplodiscus trichospermus]
MFIREGLNEESYQHGSRMPRVFTKVWGLEKELIVKEIGEKVYMFRFDDEMEKDLVLLQQSWSFNKVLVPLCEYDGSLRLDEIKIEKFPFWVQLHGLSLGLVSSKVVEEVGTYIGELLEKEMDGRRVP